MKLRGIRLENVRRFTDPVAIRGISDGLNILSEPNEAGKSTLFDALRTLFFVPYRSKGKEVQALRPHADGAPEITVTIETDTGTFDIHKRYLSKPAARILRDGMLIAQADAAEDWIAAQISGGDGGPAGLIWVRQGAVDLTGGTPKEQNSALEARRDLLSSVTGEVEAMTGGRRMDAALARARAELRELATRTGTPKAHGPWKIARDRLAHLDERCAELEDTARALYQALDLRKAHRAALAELQDPERIAGRRQRLAEAEAAHAQAERHAQAAETAARAVETATLAFEAAETRHDAIRRARADLTDATRAAQAARSAAGRVTATLAEAEAQARTARIRADEADTAADGARSHHALAQRQLAAREGAAHRSDLARRIEAAEHARRAAEEAEASAATFPDAPALREIEALAARDAAARSARDAAAAQLVVRYDTPQAPRILLHGATLQDGARVTLDRASEIRVDGIASLAFTPAAGTSGPDPVTDAQAALARALSDLGAGDLDDVRRMAECRLDAERRASEARATLKGIAPQGIDALRTALARIPAADPEGETLDPAETAAAFERAEEARLAAQTALGTAREALSATQADAARADAASEAATERLERAEAAVARLGDLSETDAADALDRARGDLARRKTAWETAAADAPDLSATDAALSRARAVEETARTRIATLTPEIATLDERIRRASGDAVEERLAEARQMREAARDTLARIEREVAILQRLQSALETAQDTARDRYFAPVAAELRPLLHLLWPRAELSWAQDTLLPDALIRDGIPEPVEILSGGTQEQIAILVRLAFARMLAKGGRHAPVILDDALVFTDDDRIERMFDALHRQSGAAQIIVLSCRQRAFRDLGGHELRLSPAMDDGAP